VDIMKHSLRTLLLSAALVVGAAAGARAQALPFDAIDGGAGSREYSGYVMREYNRVIGRFREGWVTANAKDFAHTFSEVGTFTLFDRAQIHGRGAIAEALGQEIPRIDGLELGMSEFTASGGLAYVTGPFSYVVQGASGADARVSGAFTMVLSEDQGSWTIRSLALWKKPAAAAHTD
jgi:ketosteroid isomerase-like protein